MQKNIKITRIAIIGSGGREHALVWKLCQTMSPNDIFVLPGNGGLFNSINIGINDFEAIHFFCNKNNIDTIFVGSEEPLVNGIVDYFESTGIQVLGATQKAAQLEGSKIYAKNFMQRNSVSTAAFQSFDSIDSAKDLIQKKKGDLVLKYDGLAAGKGVWVCNNEQETKKALREMTDKFGSNAPFLIEDKLIGQEISIIGFLDGNSIRLLLPSQDYKALLDNDKGGNTGGMGAVCPLPFWNKTLANQIEKDIIAPTLRGLQKEKINYKGVLYFGIMIVETAVYLLEYNVRLGDPEAAVVLPALQTDLVPIIAACLGQKLDTIDFKFNEGYYVDVVQVSGGYPLLYQKGYEIKGLEQVDTALVFHAGTQKKANKYYTNGGRVVHTVAHSSSLKNAIKKAYKACNKITFKDNFYRKDIGNKLLL